MVGLEYMVNLLMVGLLGLEDGRFSTDGRFSKWKI